jgi:hypothetical protein
MLVVKSRSRLNADRNEVGESKNAFVRVPLPPRALVGSSAATFVRSSYSLLHTEVLPPLSIQIL